MVKFVVLQNILSCVGDGILSGRHRHLWQTIAYRFKELLYSGWTIAFSNEVETELPYETHRAFIFKKRRVCGYLIT